MNGLQLTFITIHDSVTSLKYIVRPESQDNAVYSIVQFLSSLGHNLTQHCGVQRARRQSLHKWLKYWPASWREFIRIILIKLIIIIIIISGSAVFVRTLAGSHRRFRNPIKTLGRTPFDELPALRKASTYTGQHNAETQRQTPMHRVVFEPTVSVTKPSRSTPQSARPLWPSTKSLFSK
jgi:hypothetical protein